jgi:hypothetical protein
MSFALFLLRLLELHKGLVLSQLVMLIIAAIKPASVAEVTEFVLFQ